MISESIKAIFFILLRRQFLTAPSDATLDQILLLTGELKPKDRTRIFINISVYMNSDLQYI